MFPPPLRPGAFGARRIQVEHKKCLAATGRSSFSSSRGFLGSKELTSENIKFSKNQCETGACATTFCAVPTPAPSRPSATRSAWEGGSAGSRPSSRSARARDTRKEKLHFLKKEESKLLLAIPNLPEPLEGDGRFRLRRRGKVGGRVRIRGALREVLGSVPGAGGGGGGGGRSGGGGQVKREIVSKSHGLEYLRHI